MADEFIDLNGFKWPAHDTECRRVVFDTVRDMHDAIAQCKKRNIAIQAGGNCGVWPVYLARIFSSVWTFEPDPVNFECLVENVPLNVRYHDTALGDVRQTCDLIRERRNIGAHQIDEDGGELQIVRLDDMKPPGCDFLCLDIEGYELKAMRGACETIRQHRPVIQIEDKGLSARYGIAKGDAERWLAAEFGYKVLKRVHRDVILVP